MTFDTGFNTYPAPRFEDVQLSEFRNPWIWIKANKYVRKLMAHENLMAEDINLAEPSVDEKATKIKLTDYKENSMLVANLIIKYQQGL